MDQYGTRMVRQTPTQRGAAVQTPTCLQRPTQMSTTMPSIPLSGPNYVPERRRPPEPLPESHPVPVLEPAPRPGMRPRRAHPPPEPESNRLRPHEGDPLPVRPRPYEGLPPPPHESLQPRPDPRYVRRLDAEPQQDPQRPQVRPSAREQLAQLKLLGRPSPPGDVPKRRMPEPLARRLKQLNEMRDMRAE